jgi:AraC family transcriptional regulator of adaptative response/methylated-DNA-[protein]-cysteine methyltransferase
MINYQRVARAIKYINEHSTEQPELKEVAEAVHLSPYHFHRMFKEWAGITPKDFLQYTSLNHAKKLLAANQTLEETTYQTGLSSTSRLHDLFVNIERMTPGEFKNGGRDLEIRYQFADSPFGNIVIASTDKGICNLLFVDDRDNGIKQLQKDWPNADFTEGQNEQIENMQRIFSDDWTNLDQVKLHIQGTEFQLKVWEALLKIPAGKLATYSDIAAQIGNPKASRAVGTAIGRNPIAYLIPCHRVIKKVGGIGEYRWGSTRKTAMIGWEAAQLSGQET